MRVGIHFGFTFLSFRAKSRNLLLFPETFRDVSTPLDMTKQRAFQRAVLGWYRERGRDLPWRRTRDPYAVLVSEFMLQQTQVGTVLSHYKDWLRRFPNFAALARASEAEVLHAWQGLVTTTALEIFTPPQKSSQLDIVSISRGRSISSNNFPE